MTRTRQSALHLAVHQGHTRIVERLVGFGIDLNLRDEDGDTALHVALSRRSADALSMETPQLKKVLCGIFLKKCAIWQMKIDFQIYGVS